MKTLVVANQKGGVAKSTTAVHLVYAALEAGKRVLLVDFDRQGSASISFPAPEGGAGGSGSADLFSESATVKPEALGGGLWILRADSRLADLQHFDDAGIKRPARHLRALASEFDVCIFDTPGVLGTNPPMTIAALVAANAVVCPFSVGLYEGEALGVLWNYLNSVKTNGYNPRLSLMGLLPSRINTTSKEEMADLAALRAQFGEIILPLMLGQRISVKHATGKRKPVWRGTRGAGHSVAAKEWREATAYILTKLGVL